MSISPLASTSFQSIDGLLFATPAVAPLPTSTEEGAVTGTPLPDTSGAISIAGNSSDLSIAIGLALTQINVGFNLASLLSPATQQTASAFQSSLFEALLPGLAAPALANAPLTELFGSVFDWRTRPVALDQKSPSFKLQTSVQQLITQLGNGASGTDLAGSLGGLGFTAGGASGVQNLQQSFNNLVTSSGGNPGQASLQSFVKLIAANIQDSSPLGSLFDASA